MGKLTIQYRPWIHKIVSRMWHKYARYFDYDELFSIANLAAIEAEPKYDPTRAKFSTYIKPRVEGAIIRSVSKISNSSNKKLTQLYDFIEKYIQEHDSAPAQHLILEHLKISEEEFVKLLGTIRNVTVVSPDDVDETEFATEMDLDTLAEYSRVEDVLVTLSKKEQTLVRAFMEDSCEPSAELQEVFAIIRDKLNKRNLHE